MTATNLGVMLLEHLQRPVRGVRIVRKAPSSNPDAARVQIIPYRLLGKRDVTRLVEHLGKEVGPIVTSALATSEQTPFLEAGFTAREALHLLRHPLHERPSVPDHPEVALRTGRRSDLAAVLEIDRQSFDEFWVLDRNGLANARKATPEHRYRVATIDKLVVGYSVTGRSGNSSFLQRLGVSPEVRGRGIGTLLVQDSLRWAHDLGAAAMLVNTQVTNENARRLYESLGFLLSDEQLHVLEWSP